jgi:HAD superfamily hydrolase (TIGR01509 family)
MVPEAILFDLDGTLVDSERESAEAMARVIERDLGLRVTQSQRDFVIGHSWNEIHALLRREHGPALSWDRDELIRRSAAERVHVIAEQGMTIMPGAVAAVERLGARWPHALVTGSSREEAMQALRVLGLVESFKVIFAAEDYTHGKPAPDGYLAAARVLGVAPQRCVVLEDSSAGIAAAIAAGMTVIAIRAGNFAGHDQSRAHRIVDTLDEITEAFLQELSA